MANDGLDLTRDELRELVAAINRWNGHGWNTADIRWMAERWYGYLPSRRVKLVMAEAK